MTTAPVKVKGADALLAHAARTTTPALRLERVAAARAANHDTSGRVAAATQAAIRYAKEGGMTWHAIGDVLGVSAQRAQQLAGDPE